VCGLKLGFSFLDQGYIKVRDPKGAKKVQRSQKESPISLKEEFYLYFTEMLF